MPILGVTGHRILMELDKIKRGIAAGLRFLGQKFPDQPMTVLSSLAEGADRVVAQEVLNLPGGRLIAVLPLEKNDYLNDFATETSKREFFMLLKRADEVVQLPPAPTRDHAYEAAGEYVLDHCEVLFAIWDGKEAQGLGGTGDIVQAARDRKRPLVWIHAGNRKPENLEPTTLGSGQGKVSFEQFP